MQAGKRNEGETRRKNPVAGSQAFKLCGLFDHEKRAFSQKVGQVITKNSSMLQRSERPTAPIPPSLPSLLLPSPSLLLAPAHPYPHSKTFFFSSQTRSSPCPSTHSSDASHNLLNSEMGSSRVCPSREGSSSQKREDRRTHSWVYGIRKS